MSKEPKIVIMAAGMGSRYGGLKQAETMTKEGESIMDFSLFDAYKAGFRKAVIIIREEHKEIFEDMIMAKTGKNMDIEFVFQKMEDIPKSLHVPPERIKPWGTAHAVYSCRDVLDGPFAVINADDYYGPTGYAMMYSYLTSAAREKDNAACMIGYVLKNTVSENGAVTRGICKTENGYLKEIREQKGIEKEKNRIIFRDVDDTCHFLSEQTVVSMNFWGFPASFVGTLDHKINDFFNGLDEKSIEKAEFLIPDAVEILLQENALKVRVLPCDEKWCGVTYAEDKDDVTKELEARKAAGQYPQELFKQKGK